MRRDRFELIMKCLHFKDNDDLDKNDKYSKLWPFLDHIQENFTQTFVPIQKISHDEAMIEYFGRHNCKQAIRNKPIRFGYKVWCQNTSSGYLISFGVYQGKSYQGNEEMEQKLGKVPSTVMHLLSKYNERHDYPFHIYMDNLFTTIPLLQELEQNGYHSTGTVRVNRHGKSCPLADTKSFQQSERGFIRSMQTTSTFAMKECCIKLTEWLDNGVVTLASSVFETNPIKQSKQWSKMLKPNVNIQTSFTVQQYNSRMGGTDRMDQNINACRVAIRGKNGGGAYLLGS